MSLPGAAIAASVKRTASVPYFSMISIGSIDVALGLRHLLAFGIAHQAVNVDRAERHVAVLVAAHEVAIQHDHARHPEEQNVEAGDQQRRRDRTRRGRASRRASPAPSTATVPTRTRCRARRCPAPAGPPHFAHLSGVSRATMISPHLQCHAGMRCPHHSWREMHQSWMLRIHSKYVLE